MSATNGKSSEVMLAKVPVVPTIGEIASATASFYTGIPGEMMKMYTGPFTWMMAIWQIPK